MLAPTPRDLLEQATQAAYRATWSPSRGHSPEVLLAARLLNAAKTAGQYAITHRRAP